jgi:PE family
MSFLLAAPQELADAASDLAGVGSTLSTANATASAPTTGLLPAAADEVSTQIATLFSAHAQGFQRLSARAAAFHEQFVQALSASANTYATAEVNAAQTLLHAVNAPAQTLLGHPLIGSSGGSGLLGGSGGLIGQAARSALQLAPTGRASAGLLPRLLSSMTNAAVAPAAGNSIGTAIENGYLAIEPYVRYGFELAAYVVGYVPWVGFLAPQILFLYDLFEPIVQSGLFNIVDWLSRMITFSQGLSNFFAATTASINQFIHTEINWALGFLPPLPPLPPLPGRP